MIEACGVPHTEVELVLVNGESVDFALAIADAWQRCGLGRRLMTLLIDCARQRGYRAMIGDILADLQQYGITKLDW